MTCHVILYQHTYLYLHKVQTLRASILSCHRICPRAPYCTRDLLGCRSRLCAAAVSQVGGREAPDPLGYGLATGSALARARALRVRRISVRAWCRFILCMCGYNADEMYVHA